MSLNRFIARLCFGLPLVLILNSCSGDSSKPLSRTSEQHMIIATSSDPLSLDPRLVRDLPTITVMHLLYEGLMSIDGKGKLVPAVAESVAVSQDKKTYTFTLRNCLWCDGKQVTAYDFENSWKSMLAPQFPAPNAYQLYPIRGAQQAKEGKMAIADIGVKAISSRTLVVELERPTPYFLEMTSCHFYFPVSSETANDRVDYDIDHDLDEHESKIAQKFNGNGPFTISHWNHRNEFSVVKNPNYREKEGVSLERITLQVLDENTALQLYKAGDIDWAGSPLSGIPQDALTALKERNQLRIAPGAGTHWFRFNTNHEPFTNRNIRLAFALALDRSSIVQHVTQGNQLPALGIIPPCFGLPCLYNYQDGDVKNAQRLFSEGLRELNLTGQTFPKISLCYGSGERNHRIAQAVQQQWSKALGITVALENCEGQVLFDRLNKGLYQISAGSWYADFTDAVNFLELFKERDGPTNNTFWHNARYVSLIDDSGLEGSAEKRKRLLAEAEKILVEEAPVSPLFHSSYNYVKRDDVHDVYFSELGYLNFKKAFLQHATQKEH